MGYRQFGASQFEKIRRQHNIMALVGNGFDIQVMADYDQPSDTRYETFFYYLKYRKFDPGNLLVSEMEKLREAGADNWSDLEEAIGELVTRRGVEPAELYAALREVQREFSGFLNHVVSSPLMSQMGEDAMSNGLGTLSLSRFLNDIKNEDSFGQLEFPNRTYHYDLYNFLFVNFNYTALLDGFVYLDQEQFDPHPHATIDTNFWFHPNPRGHAQGDWNAETRWSSYVLTDVVHPHGFQDIPRSLLFGIDGHGDFGKRSDSARKLKKPYWARNDIRYAHLFEDTEVFIIFGCSLGASDGWWWRSIAETLAHSERSELILYWWRDRSAGEGGEDEIRNRFLNAADASEKIAQKIHVNIFSEGSDRVWLNTQLGASLLN